MKLLTKLEKSKTFWNLFGISIMFFILRLPSLIEPNWYGDEGIYQVLGKAVAQGRLLYVQIWDNKPPLLYLVYAMFKGGEFQVKLFSLIIGLLSVWAFFALANILFKNQKAKILSTFAFALLFSTPLLEGNIANAENFMLLLAILSGFLIFGLSENIVYKFLKDKRMTLSIAGILLGISFLFKIVAVFDLGAFIVFLFVLSIPKTKQRRAKLNFWYNSVLDFIKTSLIPLIIGFLLPFALTIIYFTFHNALSDFTKAVFFSNVGYVGYGNKFIIPQGFLILKLLVLFLFCCFIFVKREKISKEAVFVLVWFAFSLFNTYFSGRPYTHYTLVLVPSLCLLIGAFVSEKNSRLKYSLLVLTIVSFALVESTFKFNFKKTLNYYGNAISFTTGQKTVTAYQAFFDQKTPRDYELAAFIKTHTQIKDNIFVWGDSAQIYTLSDKLPPGRYAVAYHITQYPNAFKETQNAINRTNPKYIITLPESSPIPFYLPNYESKLIISGATIYERSL